MVRYEYDAWGNHKIIGDETLGNLNPFRYRGYYYDTETGLYYLQTRYYDPITGRFISQDGVEYADPESINDLNLYAYCGNNPVMYVDPTGTIALTALLIGLIIGAIVGAAVGGAVAYKVASDNGATGWELFGWTLLGIFGGAVIGGAIGAAVGAAAPAIGSFLGSSFTLGGFAFAGGQAAAVTVTGAQIAAGGAALAAGLTVLFARIGNSGGYRIDHHYPNDHDPTHVHISGDDGMTRVDLNGNPLAGDRPMTHGERKAFKKLFGKILEALKKWK